MPAEPETILVLCLITSFVIGLNLTLFGWLRGDRRVQAEASKWGKVFGGNVTARQQQVDQVAELRRAVEHLQAGAKSDGAATPEPRE